MRSIRVAGLVCVLVFAGGMPSSARQQDTFRDAAAMVQFQRSVDAYAFHHRQVQRRLGETVEQPIMAAGLRAARPSAADGDFFTPPVAAAFRNRIAEALQASACKIAAGVTSSEVPRVGAPATETHAVPDCVSAVLPRLPEELAYRAASVALVLVDTHANLVVDVLHGAFPVVP
jgi:hypothetical protein